jgi:hypothetical protein
MMVVVFLSVPLVRSGCCLLQFLWFARYLDTYAPPNFEQNTSMRASVLLGCQMSAPTPAYMHLLNFSLRYESIYHTEF